MHSTAQSRRVLIVDDEAPVAHAIARSLVPDCECVVETLPVAALRRLEGGERFDAILCDVMMPDMTGMDVYAQVARISRHEADRIIFMTGGVLTLRAREFLKKVPNRFVDKPLDMRELRKLIEEMAGLPVAAYAPSSSAARVTPATPRR
jgi:CheY-like chemotaxis protein